ncbi:hypothetical protein RB195_006482 [Necator americanus]|uniref:DH domain-containing protein n=1 Tax=Necator americanus TaxID=51031 RepID=A0ABR1BSU3_NECAM
MKRSASLESVMSLRSPPPLPLAPPPSLPRRKSNRRHSHEATASTSRGFSLSPLSILSPSSVIAYDFSFLEESPGIQLVHPLSDEHFQGTILSTECLPSPNRRLRNMSESLVTSNVTDPVHDVHIPTFSSIQSLNTVSDEVDGNHSFDSFDPITNEDRTAVTHGSDPMIASLGRRMYSLGKFVDDMKSITMEQRSFSAEDTSCDKENQFKCTSVESNAIRKDLTNKSFAEGSDDVEFTIHSTSSDANSCEDTDLTERTLISENPRDEEIRQFEEGEYALTDDVELPRASELAVTFADDENSASPTRLLDDSMIPLVGTPHTMTYLPMEDVFTFVERRTNQELPAITEENEEQTLRRYRGQGSSVEGRSRNGSSDAPQEPEELAPGLSSEMEYDAIAELDYSCSAAPVHRRAVSDNMGTHGSRKSELRRTQEMEEIDRAGVYEDITMRSSRSIGRASSVVSNRCQSQVFLPEIGLSDTASSAPALDRNLSSSDPSINEETPSKTRECPPPVVLTRKASSIQSDWKKQLSVGSLTQPTPVQLRKEPVGRESRPQSMTRNEKSGDRIEKKKAKSGSDTFSFGSLFGTNKGARSKKKMGVDRSLETVISNFHSKAGGSAVSLPTRRMASSTDLSQIRLPIPDFEGLPDHLSSALSTSGDFNDIESVNFELAETSKYNLNSPLWARFDLFSKEEYTSWHDKYRHDKMSSKLVKKQDAIYELILIEKAHCAHLAFLQQGYRNRLLQENVLPEADINRLIPDVLDALLVFHLHLLDRLTARQRESDEVETISDILAEELSDEGKHISIAINAYTTFGSAKERSEKLFESLMAKNGRFADFIRSTASDPLYRRFEFKSTMTRVISRPAKYGLLVETILKNEGNKFTKECELTQKALLAAKRFAMKIDNNLLMAQMAQRWDDVRSHFDHSSHTNLYLVDKEKPSGVVRITFTMEDLDMDMKHVGSGQRRLMCLGDVCMKNSSTKLVEKVFMVLFDDILVCLQRRSNQKYMFIQQEQSVFPVSGLILRPADRSASVMIISGAITKPALLEVEFNSKTDRTKWIKTLETAIHSAPVKEYKYKTNQETFFTGPL